jgi:hypothetical protein
MSDTTDCDADTAWGAGWNADPFEFDLDLDFDLGLAPVFDADFVLHARVEQYDDAPDECTIFPRVASSEFPRTTTWLTAQEGSYVSLDDAR